MRLQFSIDEVVVGEEERSQILKKFSTLDKYLTHVAPDLQRGTLRIVYGKRWGYQVKVVVSIPGYEAVAETEDKSLLTAIDQVVDKLSVELSKRHILKGYAH